MAEPFIGEIRAFAFNFAPRNWTMCYGQQLPVSQYASVYSLLGTFYGGDGRTSFGIPDLRGRNPIGMGDGPFTPNYMIGQAGGNYTTQLTSANLPIHSHNAEFTPGQTSATTTVEASTSNGENSAPTNTDYLAASVYGREAVNSYIPEANKGTTVTLGGASTSVNISGQVTVQDAGNSSPFNSMNPYLALNFCLALEGLYPQRS